MHAAIPPNPQRVVIVGAGPAGMATALELAQRGVPSTVLEARGAVATRQPLFAVIPPLADRLAALDDTGGLTRLLRPLERMDSDDLATGRHGERIFDAPLAPDASRSRGDMGALLRAADSPGRSSADTRRWSTVGIGDLENAMRGVAATRYPELIDVRYDTKVSGLRQGAGWAEALTGAAGAREAVRGAMLIDASGRNLLGSSRTVYPEQSHWVGFVAPPPAADQGGTHRVVSAETAGGAKHVSIRLPGPDRQVVWTQVDAPGNQLPAGAAHEALARRAPLVGVSDMADRDTPVMSVTVQLSTTDHPADRRILAVGDSVRSPYFMTSTGAAAALVHDAPRAVDAVSAVLGGADPAAIARTYASDVQQANAGLLELTRARLLGDLFIPRGEAQPPVSVAA
ncbi:MAG: FAD-dependent monooxygenase [Thermoleophilia bacterium]|nr:FAD-dependent monooxygenase [Thermoleophilia bacterium]